MIENGTDLMVFVNGKSIAYATSHSLQTSAETSSTSTKTKDKKGGAWNTSKITNFSWSLTSENLYSVSGENGNNITTLWNVYKSGQLVDIKFCKANESTLEAPTTGWTPVTSGAIFKGKAYITSLNVNAPDDDNASFTVEFTGDGELQLEGALTSPEFNGNPTEDGE